MNNFQTIGLIVTTSDLLRSVEHILKYLEKDYFSGYPCDIGPDAEARINKLITLLGEIKKIK